MKTISLNAMVHLKWKHVNHQKSDFQIEIAQTEHTHKYQNAHIRLKEETVSIAEETVCFPENI